MTGNQNVYEVFSAGFHGADTFIEAPGGEITLTYDDLDALSGRLALRFSELGLAPGDRVLAQVEKSAQNLVAYFACLRAGLIYLPLNTAYQKQEILHFLGDAEPRLIICDPSKTALFRSLSDAQILALDENGQGDLFADLPEGTQAPVSREADDVAVILYTSGTTGKPKGAMISHGNLASNSQTLSQAWGWRDDDVLLHALPVFHIHGLFVATNLAVLGGSRIIFLPRFTPQGVIDRLPDATVYMGVPTNYTRLLADDGLTREACRNMRLFTSGSAPLLVQTFEAFQERTGHTIVERYGMTETGMNTSNPLEGARKPGTVGPPLPGVAAKIVGNDQAPVSTGETGTLCVKGNNVFKGYWRMPEKTAEEFDADGFFITGDLASQDEDGYISIVGRSKDLVISGGLNVYPKEIESLIDKLDGVAESAVIGIPHPDFGEAVTAVIVPAPGSSQTELGIIDAMKGQVANFKVPKSVHFVDELPRNTMGKVQKNQLRERFGPKD